MYVPRHFAETDTAVLHRLIRAHPLGAVVTLAGGELVANHIPLLLHDDGSPFGTLAGHVARGNSMWKTSDPAFEALVIFQGVERYVSPSWYPSKETDPRTVPTWNYVVVHAHGPLRIIDDAGWLRRHVAELTDRHEADRPSPWKVDDAPADYVEKLVGGIVGIEIPISRLTGKWKVSQNRSAEDRDGVVRGLREQGDTSSAAMAAEVELASRPVEPR